MNEISEDLASPRRNLEFFNYSQINFKMDTRKDGCLFEITCFYKRITTLIDKLRVS